eukprot:CAMPEP_0170619300 /NCGR_PEP_ID=MMETSP0224-20130122/27443_1 /TAXON_ID=285029 /ORGANISM="Togula jolla, Strain CCCM 725" /LENGTH=347 /DNA_ID=CAMNT_0010945381 /DNA_START=77 /DNA_END=1120 /DNA_ORIENTATION=-
MRFACCAAFAAFTCAGASFDASWAEEIQEPLSLIQVKASADAQEEVQWWNIFRRFAGGGDDSAESAAFNTPDQPPLMILQRGCTGSSEIIRMAREMLPLFGVALYPTSVKELVRVSKNPWLREGEDLGTAMKRGVDDAARQRQTLIFDNFHLKDNDFYRTMNEFMVQAKTRSVIVHRNNSLDTLICDVRDCFEDPSGVQRGYTVDEEGNKIDLCFNRRSSTQATLAHLKSNRVVHHLQEAAAFPERQRALLEELGYEPAETVLVEDLYAFEYSKDNLEQSVDAWTKFFSSLGLVADSSKIREYLKKDVASRSPPGPHSKSISNLKTVMRILETDGKDFNWMLRRDEE